MPRIPRRKKTDIESLLRGRSKKRRANIKATEISKLDFVGIHRDVKSGIKIKIRSIEKIDGGIQVFAQVWKNGKQLGFGEDGSVDIERFRIFNPPVLVDDPNGEIVREWNEKDPKTDAVTKIVRTLKYDPVAAIKEDLIHTVGLVGKTGTKIIKGKVGTTVSTFYPSAGTGSGAIDGAIGRQIAGSETFSTIRAGSGNDINEGSANYFTTVVRSSSTTDQFSRIWRGGLGFDTSALPDTDEISAAVLSLNSTGNGEEGLGSADVDIVSFSPADESDYATSDFAAANWGTTVFASSAVSNFSSTGYKDFTLDSNGRSHISKTANSIFGSRISWDTDNSFGGTWASLSATQIKVYQADNSGTSKDPKLVVTHAPPVTNVTVNPAAQVATFTIPADTVKTGSTVSPAAQVASFSVPSHSVKLGWVVAMGAPPVATFSIPTYSVLLPDVQVSPSAVVATFSIPTYTIKYGWVITMGAPPVATFSIPTYAIQQGITISPSALVATFSVPAYSLAYDFTVTIAGAVVATFSIPTYTVTPETRISVAAQVATFTVPTYSVKLGSTISPATQVLTFSLPTLLHFGAVWEKKARNSNSTWARTARNST
jgi:hypothetical protein